MNAEMRADPPRTGVEPARVGHGQGVPRWPAAVALLATAGIYLLVSDRLTMGPTWLPLAVVVALLVPLTLAWLHGLHHLTRRLALGAIGTVTAAVLTSAGFLVTQLPGGQIPAPTLLLDAALIWVANVLTFTLWYWEVDGGGPAERHRHRHTSTDFVFPQMAATGVVEGWSPGFLDYLFLAYNTSTAFSPTDMMVLSRRAKVLMMTQSLTSLLVIGVLVARAIGTL